MINMEKTTSTEITKSIIELLFKGDLFSRCPICEKYLTFFEFYNNNCSICGKIDHNKIIVVDNFGLDK